MATHTVGDDILATPEAADYFLNADRRVLIGLRATLELLGLPLPDYALRKPPGPQSASAKVIAKLYAQDRGEGIPRPKFTADPNSEARVTAALSSAFRKRTTNING